MNLMRAVRTLGRLTRVDKRTVGEMERYQRKQDILKEKRSQLETQAEESIYNAAERARKLERELRRDPIKALGISWSDELGMTARPFEIKTPLMSASVKLLQPPRKDDASVGFVPKKHESAASCVEVLQAGFLQWFTIIALRVTNRDAEHRIRLDWFKKSAPMESRVFLLDEANSKYYHPVSCTLTGEVLFDHPRVGIIAFGPFTVPTDKFQLHVSDVRLSRGAGKRETFHFSYADDALSSNIEEMMSKLSLGDQVESILKDKVERVKKETQAETGDGCLGCGGCLLVTTGLIIVLVVVMLVSLG
jgi:hypothetical protein